MMSTPHPRVRECGTQTTVKMRQKCNERVDCLVYAKHSDKQRRLHEQDSVADVKGEDTWVAAAMYRLPRRASGRPHITAKS